MTGLCRPHPGIDADEEHTHSARDPVSKRREVRRQVAPLYIIRVMAQRARGGWLVKEEPNNYSYDQLERDGKTVWAGVKNPLAQQHIRAIRKGDRIFYYHTGTQKAVVAIAKALSDAYPDPSDKTGKLSVVDIGPDRALTRPVTLAEIKADPAFATFALVRISRLSVMPVTDAEWARIEKMSRS
jgi:predicted RNA-binding protein with PUA-like domain